MAVPLLTPSVVRLNAEMWINISVFNLLLILLQIEVKKWLQGAGQSYKSELCQCHLNGFLKSNVNMTLECGSIHFGSLRSNKNTKAFCVVQHGIRSALECTPGPSAASEAEIKVCRVSCGTSSVFLLIVYNLLSAVPVLGADTIKSHWQIRNGCFAARKAEEKCAGSFSTDRQ